MLLARPTQMQAHTPEPRPLSPAATLLPRSFPEVVATPDFLTITHPTLTHILADAGVGMCERGSEVQQWPAGDWVQLGRRVASVVCVQGMCAWFNLGHTWECMWSVLAGPSDPSDGPPHPLSCPLLPPHCTLHPSPRAAVCASQAPASLFGGALRWALSRPSRAQHLPSLVGVVSGAGDLGVGEVAALGGGAAEGEVKQEGGAGAGESEGGAADTAAPSYASQALQVG